MAHTLRQELLTTPFVHIPTAAEPHSVVQHYISEEQVRQAYGVL
jgi:hypothetical protein